MKQITIFLLTIFFAVGVVMTGQESTQKVEEKKKANSYGRTPDRYVPFGKFTKPYKQFFLDPLEDTGGNSRNRDRWTA